MKKETEQESFLLVKLSLSYTKRERERERERGISISEYRINVSTVKFDVVSGYSCMLFWVHESSKINKCRDK
jgi:hypothetical protein